MKNNYKKTICCLLISIFLFSARADFLKDSNLTKASRHYIKALIHKSLRQEFSARVHAELAENYFFNLEDYKFAQIGHNTALRFLTHLRKNPDFNQEYTSFEEKIDGIDLQGLFAKTPNEDMPNPFSALHPEIWKITQIAHQDKQHMTIFSRYGIDEDSQRQHPRRIR